MNRRSFLSLTTVAAPVATLKAAEEPPMDDPAELWWPMVTDLDAFTAVSPEGRLALTVALARPGEEALTSIEEAGVVVGYSLAGRPLVAGFRPGIAVVAGFDLLWDGQPVPIPPRFWLDLAGFRIQTLGVELGTLELAQRARAERCLAELDQPRVVLSADQGTAMIEWSRQERGDVCSTFRWVVSRSGTVLRHRHRSPLAC
jgi:hypothetical protein